MGTAACAYTFGHGGGEVSDSGLVGAMQAHFWWTIEEERDQVRVRHPAEPLRATTSPKRGSYPGGSWKVLIESLVYYILGLCGV